MLAWTGELAAARDEVLEGRGATTTGGDQELSSTVAALMADVRLRGDVALLEMARRFDGVDLAGVEVERGRWNDALQTLAPDVRAALERASRNIRTFHEAQLPSDVTVEVEDGVTITRSWVPLERAGVYAPGGTASYPSSVLMGVVPAKAAGVREVIVCVPPGPSGEPPQAVLAACAMAGADRVFAIGGAGAIAAMAYGTERVPSVDVIVGPGNRWVTEAKQQVAGSLIIDAPAGPSEVLLLADGTAPPDLVAVELMAQAEHDVDAVCVAVTTSAEVASSIEEAVRRLLDDAPRAAIARASLATAGGVLVADSMSDAVAFAEVFAPEHLSVMTRDAYDDARSITSAGTTFVGATSSVAFGDYMTGANHVLPTGGLARSFSGLATHHFLRAFTTQEVDEVGAAALARDVALLADVEGLPGHAAAARARIPSGGGGSES